jgi:hypothetical protein
MVGDAPCCFNIEPYEFDFSRILTPNISLNTQKQYLCHIAGNPISLYLFELKGVF